MKDIEKKNVKEGKTRDEGDRIGHWCGISTLGD